MTFAEFKKNAEEFYSEHEETIVCVGVGLMYLGVTAYCSYQIGKTLGYIAGAKDGVTAAEALVKHMEPEAYARIVAKAEEFNGLANAVNKAVG